MAEKAPKILITKKFPEEILKPLRSMAEVIQWTEDPYDLMPRDRVLSEAGELFGIINQAELSVDEELLDQAGKLKVIANVSIGYDNLNVELMTDRHVWACNAPGYFTTPVAEYVIGGILALNRKLIEADKFVRAGKWTSFQPGRWDGESVIGKTIGILGMGNIGQLVADLACAVGMQVIYHSSKKNIVGCEWVSYDALLERSDIFSIHVPHTVDTDQMIGSEQFNKMKDGVMFINTSRGKVVKEVDLIGALESGKISGAILDVFQDEPKVPDAILKNPNVLLTPHIAGGTKVARQKCYQLAVENVISVIQGVRPKNALNSISI